MVLMLERIGFRDIRVRGNYTEGPFVDGDYVMALLARR
jgi:hypothetical protein